MRPTILLLGTGYTLGRCASKLPIGSFVCTSRSEQQVQLWQNSAWLAERVDLESEDDLSALFKIFPSLTTIVDSVPPLKGADPSRYVKKVVDSLRNVSALKRVIYLSTTGVFGVSDGSWVNEESPTNPETPTGEARLRVEEAYRASGLPVHVLRLPAIYGPGRGLESSLAQGRYRLIGNGDKWTNRIHVEDLSEVIIRAIEVGSLPPVLCVADDTPTRAREVVEFYCNHFGLSFPASISVEEARAQGLYTMLSNQRVSNKLLKGSLYPVMRFPSFRDSV